MNLEKCKKQCLSFKGRCKYLSYGCGAVFHCTLYDSNIMNENQMISGFSDCGKEYVRTYMLLEEGRI